MAVRIKNFLRLIHYYTYFNIFYYNRLYFPIFCDTIFLVIIMGRKFTSEEEEILKKLGAELKRIRNNKRKNKSEKVTLADVSKGTHIKADYISKYENGKKEIGYLTLKKLCDFYKIDVSTLLYKIEPTATNDIITTLNELKSCANDILSKANALHIDYVKKVVK